MTVVLHLRRILSECSALPCVDETRGVEKCIQFQQGSGERFLVVPECLVTALLSDVLVGRYVRNGPRKKVKLWVRFETRPRVKGSWLSAFLEIVEPALSSGTDPKKTQCSPSLAWCNVHGRVGLRNLASVDLQ